jgi:hypothetical protein
MKKILVSSAVLLGVLAAQVAFAAAIVPTYGQTTLAAGSAGQMMQQQNQMYQNNMAMPCGIYNSSGSGMMQPTTFRNPCQQPVLYKTVGSSDLRAWFALMFVLTVMMVWAILLLLIGILWHMLRKHRKS